MTTEVAEDSTSTILWSFGISSKLERWKSLISGYLMSWLKINKNCHFELSSLILCNNSEPFLNWIVMCDEKWIIYQIGDDQLSGWAEKSSKALPRTKLVPKIGHGHWWSSCQSDLSESWQNHYIWEAGSANWWDAPKTARPAASIGQQNGPSSSPWQHPCRIAPATLQKLNKLDYEILPHLPYSPDLSATNLSFFKHLDIFLQAKHFHNQ